MQLLELLKKVLPKATTDALLAGKIYQAVEQELKAKARASAFESFCEKLELPNLEPQTLVAVKDQFSESFGEADVTIKPNKKAESLAVEIAMPDGTQFTTEIKTRPVAEEASDEQDVKVQFVPCPVSLPGDVELVWLLAKRETMTPEEAGITLAKLEDDFWATKMGQKLLRDRVERSFPEFIARVPAGMLSEVGLKRHYKTPEPIKVLNPLPVKKK